MWRMYLAVETCCWEGPLRGSSFVMPTCMLYLMLLTLLHAQRSTYLLKHIDTPCAQVNAKLAKRANERHWHGGLALLLGGSALALLAALIGHTIIAAIAALTLASAGIWAVQGPLLSWPAVILSGTNAASGELGCVGDAVCLHGRPLAPPLKYNKTVCCCWVYGFTDSQGGCNCTCHRGCLLPCDLQSIWSQQVPAQHAWQGLNGCSSPVLGLS